MLDDFTTIELARDAYGVVFADERTLEIDEAATEALRAELRASRDGGSLTEYFAGRAAAVERADVGRRQRRVRDRRRAARSATSAGRRGRHGEGLRAGRRRSSATLIVGGELAPGERLPNETVLADASSASAARRCARRCGCSRRRA